MYNPSNRSVNFLKPVSVIFGCLKKSNRLSPKRRKRVRFLLSTNDEDASSEEADKLFTTHENHALAIDDDKSHPLFVQDTVEIPRYTEQFVRMKLPRCLEPNDFPYLIQGHFDQSIQGIQVARAITFFGKAVYTGARSQCFGSTSHFAKKFAHRTSSPHSNSTHQTCLRVPAVW